MFDHTDPLWLAPYQVESASECENLFDDLGDAAPDLDAGETFSVYDFDGPGTPAPHLSDYDHLTDTLYIQFDPAQTANGGDPDAPQLAVLHDERAGLTRITLNGLEVAVLEGEAELDPADITLVPMP